MAGEDLDKHVNVRDVLIDMGIYFQVQVRFFAPSLMDMDINNLRSDSVLYH